MRGPLCFTPSRGILHFTIWLSCATASLSAEWTLVPAVTLPVQYIELDSSSRRYRLDNLRQATSYEVRVSYPAMMPSEIFISLVSEDGVSLTAHHARRLLNVEKLIFRTDNSAATVRGKVPLVEVTAKKAGVHRNELVKGFKRDQLVYDIVMERLEFGIPAEAFIVISIVVLLGLPMIFVMSKVLYAWSVTPTRDVVLEGSKVH
eukprot:1192043-Prorocentrum_minimum.AAC.3